MIKSSDQDRIPNTKYGGHAIVTSHVEVCLQIGCREQQMNIVSGAPTSQYLRFFRQSGRSGDSLIVSGASLQSTFAWNSCEGTKCIVVVGYNTVQNDQQWILQLISIKLN